MEVLLPHSKEKKGKGKTMKGIRDDFPHWEARKSHLTVAERRNPGGQFLKETRGEKETEQILGKRRMNKRPGVKTPRVN